MSSTPPTQTNSPIMVWATPTPDQVMTGLRYTLLAVSSVASALGLEKLAGGASALLAAVGPIAVVVVFIWGQLVTRATSKQKAIMATALPDSIAQTK